MKPISFSRQVRSMTAAFAVLAVSGWLGGCSSEGPGAPVEYKEAGHLDVPVPPRNYTVQPGDTIYGIARQFNMSVRALIDANHLQPPFKLKPGLVLNLPLGGDYVVVKGDTLLGVARRTGAAFSTLARMNDLAPPYILRVGQRLKLPASGSAGSADFIAPPPAHSAPQAAVSVVPLAPPPGAGGPQAQQGEKSSKKGAYATLAEREAAATPAPLAPAPAVPVTPQAPQPPAHVVAAAAPPPAVATVQPKPGKGFLWPAQGPVISEFGSSSKGVHNDGINIAVDKGTPVLASEDGIVAYSGNELRGFGNLLLIKHPDGLMTAYAHNDALLVKRGESVRRGQQIAKSGDTGGVSQPQLHFEVRQGTRAVDPMPYLRGGMTPVSAPGGVSPGSSPADPPDPG